MKSAKKTSLLSYLSVVFYVIAGFLYTPYLVKTLGMSDYGIYALAASLIGYFSLDFGIGAAQTRLAAKYIAEGINWKIRDMLGITTRIFLTIDGIILLVLCVVYTYSEDIFTNLTAQELVRFKNVFLITSLYVLVNFPMLPLKGLYQAFDRMLELTLIELIYKMSNILCIVLALYWGWGIYGVVCVNVGTNIITQLFRLYYIFKQEKLAIHIHAKDKSVVSFITSFSLWATVAMIADKFFFGIIPFLLAAFSNTTEVAFFAIVISIEGYTLSISRSLSGIFLPRVMKMVVSGQTRSDKTALMIRIGRIQLYIVGLIITGLISLGQEFIFHWLGTGFDKSYYCLLLVMFPCMFHLTQTIAEELLLATNNVRYRAYSYVVGSSLSVLSIVFLSPKYGALAAAIGVCLSFLVAHNFLIDLFYHKKIGVDMITFFKKCHFQIMPSLFICCMIGFFLQNYIVTQSFITFLIKGAAWVCISVVILWTLAFNSEEKKMVYQTFAMFK